MKQNFPLRQNVYCITIDDPRARMSNNSNVPRSERYLTGAGALPVFFRAVDIVPNVQAHSRRLLRHRRTDGARIAPNHSHCFSHPSAGWRSREYGPRDVAKSAEVP